MNIEQEKYLMKRIEDIRTEKTNEINNEASIKKYGSKNTINRNSIIEIKNFLKKKGKENIKLKRKITPKFIFDMMESHISTYDFICEILDLSEYKKIIEKIDNERTEKIRKLNEAIDKFKRDIILRNECDDILKLINEFENIKI